MRSVKSVLVVFPTLLMLLSGPSCATGAKTEEAEPQCQKKVGTAGRPHKLNTVASLSAVRAWSQRAMKHGENYSMWHNAEGASIKCEKLPRSDYYKCFASGKPCKGSTGNKTAVKTQ